MKKCCSLALALLLCLLSFTAVGEEPRTVTGYDFSFRFHLNAGSFPPARRARLQGYADALEAMAFRGSCFYEPESQTIDFTLELLPDHPDAEPVSLHVFGYPETLMCSSPLLGEETVLFSNISLMEFVNKTHEHLGLNLQYAALLYPYVYEYSLRWIIQEWNKVFHRSAETRSVSPKKIEKFAGYLENAFTEHTDVERLIRAFCLSNDFEETIRAEIYNLPMYLTENLTRGRTLRVTVEPGSEIWSISRGAPFYSRLYTDQDESILTDFPQTPGGYQPSFSFSRHTGNGSMDLSLSVGWTRNGDDDLLAFRLAADALPVQWPAEAASEGEISLLGALYPNFAFGFSLQSDASGRLQIHIKKPSGEKDAGEVFLTAEGTVLPRDYAVPYYSWEDIDACVDILRVNDVSLADFKTNVSESAAMGLIRFLIGVPASACQSFLDDLTDMGILSMLLSD